MAERREFVSSILFSMCVRPRGSLGRLKDIWNQNYINMLMMPSYLHFIKPISCSMNTFLTKMENAPKQTTADGSHQTDENYIDTLEQENGSLSITRDFVKKANSQAHPDPESETLEQGPSKLLHKPSRWFWQKHCIRETDTVVTAESAGWGLLAL